MNEDQEKQPPDDVPACAHQPLRIGIFCTVMVDNGRVRPEGVAATAQFLRITTGNAIVN